MAGLSHEGAEREESHRPLTISGLASGHASLPRELLELLWVLEHTTAGYAKQKRLLEAVLDSELFTASELPPVPASAREAPKVPRSRTLDGQLSLAVEE